MPEVSTAAEPELTKADVVEQADDLCRDYADEAQAIQDKIRRLNDRFPSEVTDEYRQAVSDIGDELEPLVEKFADRWEAIDAPPSEAEFLDDYGDLNARLDALRTSGIEAVANSEDAKLATLDDEIDRLEERRAGLAEGYGFEVCGHESGT